ncbi:Exopolysaccharide synthesis protein, partial [Candidatus Magnetomorum sp. HK-1]
LGTALAFTFEILDNTLKNPEDIREYLKIPYLGPVPTFDLEKEGVDKPELITHYSPKSTASESYRGIRTSLLFSSADKVPKIILVTSAGPSEGKTLTSTNLAITMAQAGSRVIIVDCDMRKPKVHKMFNLSRDMGMSSVLVSEDLETILNDVTLPSGIPNLEVIPCGPIPPNPSEIIGSQKMSLIMDELGKRYDRIIVDSPPITAVTDSTVLAKFVDGVMLVVHAGVTPKQVVKTGLEQIQGVEANVLGAVLNDVDTGKESYYYYQYYYYYYGEDGDKKKKNQRKKRSSKRYG